MRVRVIVAILAAVLPAVLAFSVARGDGGGGQPGAQCCVWEAQQDSTCSGYPPGSNGCFHGSCASQSTYLDNGSCVIHVDATGTNIDCRDCSLFVA
jgi:hypothetical protein